MGGYNSKKNLVFTAGGPLSGTSFNTDDIVITGNINSFYITKKKDQKVEECSMCGICQKVCPVNLVPVFIMKNINNKKRLMKLDPKKCLECGLCSYMCPSSIDLKEYIKKAKVIVSE